MSTNEQNCACDDFINDSRNPGFCRHCGLLRPRNPYACHGCGKDYRTECKCFEPQPPALEGGEEDWRKTPNGIEKMFAAEEAGLLTEVRSPQPQEKTLGEIARETCEGWLCELNMQHCTVASDDVWDRISEAVEAEAVRRTNAWIDGLPPHPWTKEWFIAILNDGDKVVLTALPEEYSYDYKTADDTYFKKEKIVKWMQFPNSSYVSYAEDKSATQSALIVELREALKEAHTYIEAGNPGESNFFAWSGRYASLAVNEALSKVEEFT